MYTADVDSQRPWRCNAVPSPGRVPFMSRIPHLLVAVLLVGAYYAGLPGHLWEQERGFKPSATAVIPDSPAWRVRELGEADPEAARPHLMAQGKVLRGLWRDREGWQLFHPDRGSIALELAEPAPEQAFLVDLTDSEPALVARYPRGAIDRWYYLRADERRRLHPGPLPVPNWHGGPPVPVKGGVAMPLHEPRAGGRLAVLHLGADGRIRALAPAGRAADGGPPALLVDNPAEALLVEAGTPRTWSADGGHSWQAAGLEWPSPEGETVLPVRRGPGWWWLLSVEHADGEEIIRVTETRDHGKQWRRLSRADWHVGVTGDCPATVPAAAHTREGRLHLLHRGSDCRVRHGVLVGGES